MEIGEIALPIILKSYARIVTALQIPIRLEIREMEEITEENPVRFSEAAPSSNPL